MWLMFLACFGIATHLVFGRVGVFLRFSRIFRVYPHIGAMFIFYAFWRSSFASCVSLLSINCREAIYICPRIWYLFVISFNPHPSVALYLRVFCQILSLFQVYYVPGEPCIYFSRSSRNPAIAIHVCGLVSYSQNALHMPQSGVYIDTYWIVARVLFFAYLSPSVYD